MALKVKVALHRALCSKARVRRKVLRSQEVVLYLPEYP